MARASMSSMTMLPPTASPFYSGIQPNYGQQSAVSQTVVFYIISPHIQYFRYLLLLYIFGFTVY